MFFYGLARLEGECPAAHIPAQVAPSPSRATLPVAARLPCPCFAPPGAAERPERALKVTVGLTPWDSLAQGVLMLVRVFVRG